MKKKILLILAVLATMITQAQINNGGFEDWSALPTFSHPDLSPAGFTSTNNEIFYDTGFISCTEVEGSEGSAVRIETIEVEGETVPGFGVTGNTPEGDDLIFSGGFPFNDMNATGMTFDRRYNIGFTSPGFVIVQFLAEGVPVTGGPDGDGTYFSILLGSQGSWSSATIDFTANPLTQTPDECIVAFACNDVINGTGVVGNYLEIDNIVFNGTSETMPGGDFNTWEEVPAGMLPDNWDSYLPANLGLFQQSDLAYEGDHSIRINTYELFGDTIMGSIHQGELNEEGLFPNQLLEPGSNTLEFYYQYEPTEMDSGTVVLVLSENLDPTPEEISFYADHLGHTEGWTQHLLDFSEVSMDVNYYGLIFIPGMDFDDIVGPETWLWLDAVSFLGSEECEFTPTINEGDLSLCLGGDILLTTQEYDSYEWFGAEAGESFEMVSEDATLAGEDAESGVFEVFVNATLDGCTAASEIITIEVYDIPEPIISILGESEVDICAGETVLIELENADDYDTYQWQLEEFNIPFQNEATYEAVGILELSANFTIQVSTPECPDFPVMSEVVIVNSHLVPEPTISQDGNTLETESGMDTYQWYLDGVLIDGANNATYEALEDGSYTVVVTTGFDCEGESDDLVFTYTGIEEYASSLKVYPNPVQDQLILSMEGIGNADISVINLLGQTIQSMQSVGSGQRTIDCSGLENGTYILNIKLREGSIQKTVIVQR